MLLFILAYLGGVFTIVSPCILPVLPFVFARAGQPFLRSTLPMLIGMAVTFAGVATLAAVGGGWAVEANEYGRYAAMLLLAAFGIILLFPTVADHVTRPLVALGSRLSEHADREQRAGGASISASLLLGVATGLLWAPCAGPVLGLILTGAALQGANASTTILLAAYALGAATSLALALLVGGRIYQVMKSSLGAGEWLRRGIGVAVIVAVGAIFLGADTGFLTRVSLQSTASIEQSLIDTLQPQAVTGSSTAATQPSMTMQGGRDGGQGATMKPSMVMQANGGAMMSANNSQMMMSGNAVMMTQPKTAVETTQALPVEAIAPPLAGAVEWLNSPPLSMGELTGKVVLVDFWTYSCINCLRAIPYVRAWAEKYRDQGLVVIGVHAPEFAFEKRIDNVKQAIDNLTRC